MQSEHRRMADKKGDKVSDATKKNKTRYDIWNEFKEHTDLTELPKTPGMLVHCDMTHIMI